MRRKRKQSAQAVVEKVVPEGKRGSYVVTRSEIIDDGTITFSEDAWEPDSLEFVPLPEPRTIVVLTGLFKTPAGWRARKARLLRPEDQIH